MLRVCGPCGVQARQVLEREFNNVLALGTDRRLDEVTGHLFLCFIFLHICLVFSIFLLFLFLIFLCSFL